MINNGHTGFFIKPMITSKLIRLSILIAGIICYLYYGIYKIIFVPFGLGGGDFMFIYRAAQYFVDGRSIYYSTAPYFGSYFYPPLAVLFFLPICLLKPHDAIVGWFILTHIIVVCSACLIYRCGSQMSRLNSLVAVVAAFGFSTPLFANIHTGNINILILLGLSLTYFLILSGRERIAPLALAFSSFLKIYPALLIAAFFHKKHWIFIKYFIFFSIILTLISLGIFGLREHEIFLKRLPDGYKYVGPIYNASFTSILKLLMNDQNGNVITIISMIFAAILFLSWWYVANKKPHPQNDNAALCVNMFIISIIIILVFPASNAMYQFICIIPFYFILFSGFQYSGRLKKFNVFIILFFLISFWDIIVCHLPLPQCGLTIETIWQRRDEFPLLYPIFCSLSFLFNLSLFLWLLMNYNELRKALTFIFTENSPNSNISSTTGRFLQISPAAPGNP